MIHHVLNAVAQVSAERLLDSLAIGFILAAFAWTLLRVPRQNSATRFSVWFAALVGTAMLPVVFSVNHTKATSALPPLISVPASWALYLFVAWAAIVTIAVARVGLGFIELQRLRRNCRPIQLHPKLHADIARFCPSRKVRILSSDHIHVPTAIGFSNPAVIIPARLMQELTAAELNQVLLHELAHLRRWDDWTNVVQQFVKALLFFHPAVWWMEQRISLEREMACDDAVVTETSSPRAYAQCLANLAEKNLVRRSAALAQAAVHRVRQTSLRVARILDVNRPQFSSSRKSAVALVATFAGAFIFVAWHAPRLVAFQDAPTMVARLTPAPSGEQLTSMHAAGVTARLKPVAPMAERKPSVIPAKARINTEHKAGQQQRNLVLLAEHRAHDARVIPAGASAAPQPSFTTGVLVIVLDDPVFGPTPVLWRFAVWRAQPQHASQAQSAAPRKST